MAAGSFQGNFCTRASVSIVSGREKNSRRLQEINGEVNMAADDDDSMSWLDDLPDLNELQREIREFPLLEDMKGNYSPKSDSWDYSSDGEEDFCEEEVEEEELSSDSGDDDIPGCSTKYAKNKRDYKNIVHEMINSERIVLFTNRDCPRSETTRELLQAMELTFEVFEMEDLEHARRIQLELNRRTGKKTMPKVFMEGKYYGTMKQVEKALTKEMVHDISPFDRARTRSTPNLPWAQYSKFYRRPFDAPKTKYQRNPKRSVSV